MYFIGGAASGAGGDSGAGHPARQCELMLRLYAPTKAFFDKKWTLADVEQAK